MCNYQEIDNLNEVEVERECQFFDQQHQSVSLMDCTTVTAGSTPSSNDDIPRVKFLCSFLGSILPRPQDGKLRYVGGETRIVNVPRDLTYEELMGKMRELLEGAALLKYQQPDEDLDALVSVVNDDDVTNMMEEYDKLGSRDGFIRLRIFLFLHNDPDGSLHFGDGDERDNERRYVDALNLNESPEYRRQPGESLAGVPFDDGHVAEQFFNQINLEGSFHGQRNMELPIAQMNLRRLTIPHLGSGQPQQPIAQRYNEMETPWSPGYYSPRHPGNMDQRQFAEFPSSPSSRCRTPYGDFPDRIYSEDYSRPPVNTQFIYEQPLQYSDNVVLIPTGSAVNEKAGFPGNILQGSSTYEGNSICESCRMNFPKNQVYPESSRKASEQSHLETPNLGNGFIQVPNSCSECPPNREVYMLSSDANMYPAYQNDPRFVHPKTHNHERGWTSPHQSNPWAEESRPHISVAGRLADGYTIENGMNILHGCGNVCDGHHVQSPYIHHEDQRYARSGLEYGNQVFQDHAVASGSHIHLPSADGIRFVNPAYRYVDDNLHLAPQCHIPSQALWRNGVPSYEASVSHQLANGSVGAGVIRGTVEGSPRVQAFLENQNLWADSSQKIVFNGSHIPEHFNLQTVKLTPNMYTVENPQQYGLEPVQSAAELTKFGTSKGPFQKADPASLADDKSIPLADASIDFRNDTDITKESNHAGAVENSVTCGIMDKNSNGLTSHASIKSNVPEPTVENGGIATVEATNVGFPKESLHVQLEVLPELTACVEEAALRSMKEMKSKIKDDAALGVEHQVVANEHTQKDADGVDANAELEVDFDNENVYNSKIEPTKAEAEAIDQGLQTIKSADLEEIRELGSGTYGAVYHGKWKGSDVAIKRIKASCFAGKPSERGRLIADFWKEALILSSLHHPNVVSFYGVVRDGEDGSLATVTEFMINGSLKQFLQKKDRTIDRRKRLIIAMDAAFGMEYLHGKNIVHFDLKCENLLVNMRDPHRPVCKIGDLGLSKVKQHTLVSGGVRGTLPWMAPELLSGKSKVTEKIDVYSFGIVMWELLTGDEPYADMHCASIIGGIVNNTLRPQIPTWCNPEWKSLMESCWASDPSERPSFSEISQKLRNMAAEMNLK
ncbi:RAF-like serine/threonine-protein kinase 20 isoform X1 [Primulina tabacum]|uniref:RAF-like serine/threonine-protein kinase 20 isoform X1 n=2 Tax=Primulina tabacum TaxID=48773 RepID=UPI003F5A3ABC